MEDVVKEDVGRKGEIICPISLDSRKVFYALVLG